MEWGENRGEKEVYRGHASWKEKREEKKELGEGTMEIEMVQISFLCIEYKQQTGNMWSEPNANTQHAPSAQANNNPSTFGMIDAGLAGIYHITVWRFDYQLNRNTAKKHLPHSTEI